jgi:anaerobic magnesium-protoporphyrin IX monomethyl ester cyclase
MNSENEKKRMLIVANFKLALVLPIIHRVDEGIASLPYNLLVLASYIRSHRNDVEIKIIDGNFKEVFEETASFNPDIVALTATTAIINDAYKYADWCRDQGYKTIIGGVHASALPDEAAQHCDYVCVNEGEEVLLGIITKMINSEPIIDKVFDGKFLPSIDNLPMPAYDLVDMEKYIKKVDIVLAATRNIDEKDIRGMTIFGSRGCPYRCIFCYNSSGCKPLRQNSVENFIKEIKYMVDTHGVNTLFFGDDELLLNRPRMMELLKRMKEEKILVHWSCQGRADTIVRYGIEGMTQLKENGCYMISIGAESGNQRVLKLLKADTTTVEDNAKAIDIVNKAGITPNVSFILGTPTETKEEMMDTVNFILKNKITSGGLLIATAYPGTKLYTMALERGLITKDLDYDKFRTNAAPEDAYIVCDTMPREDFIKFFRSVKSLIAEDVTYKRIMDSKSSPLSQAFKYLKIHPVESLTYLFKHPIKSANLILRRRG